MKLHDWLFVCTILFLPFYSNVIADQKAERIVEKTVKTESDITSETAVHRSYLIKADEIETPDWIKDRADKQMQNIAETEIFHDFRYVDRIKESGIQFRNRVVPDGGKLYKAVHYDHGNGIAVADVNGDGLYDIYFVNQVGGNELWKNIGGGRFENITQVAGVSIADRICISASFADIDNDGDPDLYVTTVRDGNVLLENDSTGIFKDISVSSNLDYSGHSSGTVFFDYDRDGLLDVFITNVGKYTTDKRESATLNYPNTNLDKGYSYYVGYPDAFHGHLKPERAERSLLFRNMGKNRFVDVTDTTGLVDESWSGDASALDLNDDGRQDIYVLNMQGHDEYYENIDGKKFVKKSREYFPATSWGAMGIKVFDYNNDGRMDIYITDMHTDMRRNLGPNEEKNKMDVIAPTRFTNTDGIHIQGNSFFRNEGDGKFSEISDDINVENFWPWGPSVGDLNADGYQDIFVSASMNMSFRYATNNLLLNDKGKKFIDSEFVLGVEPRLNNKTAKPWYVYDCNDVDKTRNFCDGRQGLYEFREALGTRSSVIFDIDNDGDLDIITNEWNWNPMVLVSNLSEKKQIHYLQIRLVGKQSNRDGLGAKVTVNATGKSFTQVYDGKSGYLSQSSYPLYFGLDDADKIDQIEVIWPSGKKQVITTDIKINSLLSISEN